MDAERLLTLQGHGVQRWRGLAPWMSATLFGLLSMTALVVVARRLAGALAHPLEPSLLWAVGILAAGAAVAIRVGWRLDSAAAARPRFRWVATVSVSLSAVMLGTALCTSGTRVAGMIVFWTLLALEEGWAWWRISRPPTRLAARSLRRMWRRDRPEPPASQGTRVLPVAPLPLPTDELLPENVTQHLVRSQAANGSDTLSGFVRIVFATGQRTGSIHVAFCPPFVRTPELAVAQLEGPEARIKTAQLLPYGARLDLKLAAEAEHAVRVLLQFAANAKGNP